MAPWINTSSHLGQISLVPQNPPRKPRSYMATRLKNCQFWNPSLLYLISKSALSEICFLYFRRKPNDTEVIRFFTVPKVNKLRLPRHGPKRGDAARPFPRSRISNPSPFNIITNPTFHALLPRPPARNPR